MVEITFFKKWDNLFKKWEWKGHCLNLFWVEKSFFKKWETLFEKGVGQHGIAVFPANIWISKLIKFKKNVVFNFWSMCKRNIYGKLSIVKIWLPRHRTNLQLRFCKILWSSQNIWTLMKCPYKFDKSENVLNDYY